MPTTAQPPSKTADALAVHTRDNLASLQGHILAQEARHDEHNADLTWVLSALSLAGKTIANKVRRARIEDVLGSAGDINVHGESQQKLDVISNEILLRCLGNRPSIAVVASEENEEPMILRRGDEGGTMCVLFDPLDGSSNLDVCVGVGTIFSVLRNDPNIPDAGATLMQPGTRQLAAGYILYGSSVVLVLTTGHGVDMFVLDPAIGSFVLVQSNIKMPATGKTYAVNEAYRRSFPDGYNKYLDWAHANGYSSRYIGSMVADVHRSLLKGGVFLYPPTKKNPHGKLRLMYEANPLAFIIEQAGGTALAPESMSVGGAAGGTGVGGTGVSGTGVPPVSPSAKPRRIMDIMPQAIHQRTSVVMGSAKEVENVVRFL